MIANQNIPQAIRTLKFTVILILLHGSIFGLRDLQTWITQVNRAPYTERLGQIDLTASWNDLTLPLTVFQTTN